jgi:hypothetical protein
VSDLNPTSLLTGIEEGDRVDREKIDDERLT